jgi:putative phosphoribosyl transferase
MEAVMTFPGKDLRFPFYDHRQAGHALANRFKPYAGRDDVVVVPVTRGGIPVGIELASTLHLPLAVLFVRKLDVPGHENVTMGSVGSGGLVFLNRPVIDALHVPEDMVEAAVQRGRRERLFSSRLFSRGRTMPDLRDKVVVLTDDGIATGSTMEVAVQAVREKGARQVLIAVPVAQGEIVTKLCGIVDRIVCLMLDRFFANAPELQPA